MKTCTSFLKKFFGRDGVAPACCHVSGEKKEGFQDIKDDPLEGQAGPGQEDISTQEPRRESSSRQSLE